MSPIITSFLILCGSSPILRGEEAQAPSHPLEELLSNLASESFVVRETAQIRLKNWPWSNEQKPQQFLADCAKLTTEPEVTFRLREEAEVHFLSEAQPYYGFEFLRNEFRNEEHRGIKISNIIPDSPAERAGLWINDILVGLGDLRFENLDPQADILAELLKQTTGHKVKLLVLRQDREVKIAIRLGSREYSEAEAKDRKKAFTIWWTKELQG